MSSLDIDSKRTKLAELRSEFAPLASKPRSELTSGEVERLDNLDSGIERLESQIDSYETRHADLREKVGNPGNTERTFDEPTPNRAIRFGSDRVQEDRDRAIRTLHERSELFTEESGTAMEDLVERDATGVDSRYLTAVADPHYERAFAKKLLAPEGSAQAELEPKERDALRRVGEVMSERSLAIGDGTSSAGLAAPIVIDPTIMLESDGEINPIRQLATVTTISTSEWRGIASEGVEATFEPESTEVGDGTPTLRQPVVRPEKAQMFVPFTIEAGADWSSLQTEIGRLFSDAKDVLEADVFIGGTSSPQPEGIVTGGTFTVSTAGTALALDDVYSAQEALPPRFQPRAVWLASNTTTNTVHRFVAKGDETEAPLMSDDRSAILGKPVFEVSTLGTATPLVYGDLASAYRIVDRVGLTIELAPLLFGSNRRPTGERGLYAYWRTSALVQVPNAIRVVDNT